MTIVGDRRNNEEYLSNQQQYKVSQGQIRYMNDIAEYRNKKSQHIYQETLYLKKIGEDINKLTHSQDKKLDNINNDIVSTLQNTKETERSLLNIAKEEKAFKDNKFCIMSLILGALVLIMMVLNTIR
jgi:hypothetical protein